MNTDKRTTMVAAMAFALAFAPSALGGSSEEFPTSSNRAVLVLDKDAILDEPLRATTIIVSARIQAAVGLPLIVHAESIKVQEGGALLGYDAGSPAPTIGEISRAGDGMAGGNVELIAPHIETNPGAQIAGGLGADGGAALGSRLAIGGHGGAGGSVMVWTNSQIDLTRFAGGGGGNGGSAVVVDGDEHSFAVAGDGGDSGSIWLNGAAVETPNNAGVVAPQIPCIEDVRTCTSSVKPLVQRLIESGPGDVVYPDCGVAGTPGPSSTVGHGGNGGDACANTYGSDGSGGANGNSGFWGCSGGGPGGHAPSAVGGTATAGNGGNGFSGGGDGGNAEANGEAGDGGDGGNGGKATIGPDCAGGDGGNGGNAAGGSANAGTGGAGVCGPGGMGGTSTSTASPGAGGAGGAGNPQGRQGINGTGTNGATNGGQGGQGADGPFENCPI